VTIDLRDDLGHRVLAYRAEAQVYRVGVVGAVAADCAVEPLVGGKTARADVARGAE